MTQISGNIVGVDFADVWSAGESRPRPFRTGTTVLGINGKTYQYARASASIASGNTAAAITLSSGEYVAAASGGSADNASGQNLVAGDHAWFILD